MLQPTLQPKTHNYHQLFSTNPSSVGVAYLTLPSEWMSPVGKHPALRPPGGPIALPR